MLLSSALCLLCLFVHGFMANNFECLEYFGNRGMVDLDVSKMAGQWWEYQTFNAVNLNDPFDHDCLTAKFYPLGNNRSIVLEDYIRRVPCSGVTDDQKEHTRREWALDKNDMADEHLPIDFLYSTNTENGTYVRATYRVMYTDYENWFYAVQCSSDFKSNIIMTRSQSPEEEMVKRFLSDMPKSAIKAKYQRKTYTTKRNANCKPVNFPEKF